MKKRLEKIRKLKRLRSKLRWQVLTGIDFKVSNKDYEFYEKNKCLLGDNQTRRSKMKKEREGNTGN